MNIYLIDCDEYVFLTSIYHEALPSFFPFQSFESQDTLAFIVQGRIAGVARVEGDKKLRFQQLVQPTNRLPLLGTIRTLLVCEWGIHIEENIRAYQAISAQTAPKLLALFEDLPADAGFYLTNIEHLLEEATAEWKKARKQQQKEHVRLKMEGLVRDTDTPIPTTDHAKAQFYLKEIANITNCGVWTASNDKNRLYKGEKLGEDDIESFPAFALDTEVKKRIQLIDTIWFQGDVPVRCFEIETTSSIFSGLLRMSDVISSISVNNINLYIVAPNERKNKVLREMNRPVFRAIGLPSITRFISIESLAVLYQKIKGLNGYISPHVIDTIALNVEELSALESF